MRTETTKLATFVRTLRQELGDLQLQQVALFLEIAADEGISSPVLESKLKVSGATVSRNVKLLSKYPDKGSIKGLDLVRTEPDLYERRRFVYFLTDKGKRLIEKLGGTLLDT